MLLARASTVALDTLSQNLAGSATHALTLSAPLGISVLALPQVLRQLPQLETLVLRSPSSPAEEQQQEGEAEGRQGQQGGDTPLDRARSHLLDVVTSLTVRR